MNFREEIKDLLDGDASINSIADNIYYGALPDNFSRSNNYLVWLARVEEARHAFDRKGWGDKYLLTIKAVGGDPLINETLGEYTKIALHNYTSTQIKSIYFEREVDVWDNDNDLFTLSMDFSSQYDN